MKRWAMLIYGIVAYLMFFGVFIYSVLFVGNLWITRTLDSDPNMATVSALGIDLLLLTLFAMQHSGMARPRFKDWMKKQIPESAERSTYVLLSNFAMIAIFAFWQPIGGSIWTVEHPFFVGAIYGVYFVGWTLLFVSTCAICHFDLFGIRQVWCYFQCKQYVPREFRVPALYSVVRHPLYVGWLIIFWATPTMTLSHLVFAAGTTFYILVAIQLEERDLIRQFGKKYLSYQKLVPMLVPRVIRSRKKV